MSNYVERCPLCGCVENQLEMSEDESAAFALLLLRGSATPLQWRLQAQICKNCNLPYAVLWPFADVAGELLTSIRDATLYVPPAGEVVDT